ncbi:MAG TPA: YciI family protein [Dokdonella sp.]|uniref:YciI family protein n=1 Tax=Dokdonella sp. TaxID=2291710 RepID=UPI002CB0348E|nr:YciI family protein [Dokdonella sp.]HUD41284.1 YciI family protein [Dokdonella sp.]
MARFLVILSDKQRGRLSDALLLAHVRHLRTQAALGHLILCGPFTDDDGALQVLEATDAAAAQRLVEADPFVREGYYRRYGLHAFIEANEANDWLIGAAQTAANRLAPDVDAEAVPEAPRAD